MSERPVIAAKHDSTIMASIQVLRALAAWMVVGAHFCNTFSVPNPNWVQRAFLDHGAKGVDIFFIISGFVMAVSASVPGVTPRQFAAKRVARIVPAYWFYTLVVALLITQAPAVMVNWGYSDESLVTSLLFFPSPNPLGIGNFPLLTVGWTLNLEMIFYVIVAVSLFVTRPQRWLWIAGSIVVLQLLMVRAGLWSTGYHDSVIYEFLMGIAAAHLWQAGALRGPWWGFVTLAIVAVVCLVVSDPSYLPVRALGWGAPAFLLVCACVGLEPYFQRATILIRLGDHSYSVYLIHTIVISIASYIHHTHRGHFALVTGCSLSAIALGGWASYRFLERPAGRLVLRWLRLSRAKPISRVRASSPGAL